MQADMKQTLVIGSTVVDVLLGVPALPKRGEDINITTIQYRIGGCAYNVYKTLRLFESPSLLCSPVGTGVYGKMVKKQLEAEGIKAFVSLEEENGCCFCLVEPDGERSFISYHGAEYVFSRSWMRKIDLNEAGSVFICGLEVEEPSGEEIIDFVYEYPELELYFAPGPRVKDIPASKMERLLTRRDKYGKGPILHLNETEILRYTGEHVLEEGALYIAEKTGNSVVITLAEQGCYCLEAPGTAGRYIPGYKANVIETVGAGDAHCGALIACLKNGMNLEESCRIANKIGAAVVGIPGSVPEKLPDWP
jgi:sugar/nucleoside kinase (ribokinase family)